MWPDPPSPSDAPDRHPSHWLDDGAASPRAWVVAVAAVTLQIAALAWGLTILP